MFINKKLLVKANSLENFTLKRAPIFTFLLANCEASVKRKEKRKVSNWKFIYTFRYIKSELINEKLEIYNEFLNYRVNIPNIIV